MRGSVALDDVGAKAVEVARARAAGVDHGGGARLPRVAHRVHSERGTAPVDVRVQIDEPRSHEPARHVADFAGVSRIDVLLDRGDQSVLEGDVGRLVPSFGGVEQAPALEYQVVHGFARPP